MNTHTQTHTQKVTDPVCSAMQHFYHFYNKIFVFFFSSYKKGRKKEGWMFAWCVFGWPFFSLSTSSEKKSSIVKSMRGSFTLDDFY